MATVFLQARPGGERSAAIHPAAGEAKATGNAAHTVAKKLGASTTSSSPGK